MCEKYLQIVLENEFEGVPRPTFLECKNRKCYLFMLFRKLLLVRFAGAVPSSKQVARYSDAGALVSELPEPVRSAMFYLINGCSLPDLGNVCHIETYKERLDVLCNKYLWFRMPSWPLSKLP